MEDKKKGGWGGARPNSGRRKGEGWVGRTHNFRPSDLETVDRLANYEGMSRAAWVNRAIAKEIKVCERRNSKIERTLAP